MNFRGTAMGIVSGGVNTAITGDKDAIWKNAIGGLAGGISTTLSTNMLFGPGVYFDDSFVFGKEGSKPIYRSSGVLSLFPKMTGISWGRTAYANKNYYKDDLELKAAFVHEGTHWRQQQVDGFGKFYGKTAKNYIQSTIKYGNINPLYNGSYKPYNYEHMARTIELLYLNTKGYEISIPF